MKDFLQHNKMLLLGVALAAVAAWGYFTFFSGSSGGGSILTSTDAASPVSKDILAALADLNSIKLDSTVFTDPTFVSLTDLGVVIPPQNVGRRNPFAPVGQ